MSDLRIVIAAALAVGACGSRREPAAEQDKALERRTAELEEKLETLEKALEIVDAAPTPAPGPVAALVDAAPAEAPLAIEPCVDPEQISSVRFTAKTTLLCTDDECTTFARDGRRLKAEPRAWPIEARVDVVDDHVEVCPPDRACVRFAPALGEDEHVGNAYLRDTSLAAVVIGDRVELWDVVAGRRRAVLETADLGVIQSIEFPRGAVLVETPGAAEHLFRDTVFGLDGKRRIDLGKDTSGLRNYAYTERMMIGFVLGEEDLGEVVGYDLATGKRIGRVPLTPIPDDLVDIDEAGGTRAVLLYAGAQPRAEVVDLARGTRETRAIPPCPDAP